MSQSYFERAKQWINSAEDIDTELIETTINRFKVELSGLSSQTPKPTSKFDDLSQTIQFLEDELNALLETGNKAENQLNIAPLSEEKKAVENQPEDDNYNFDPSSLVDLNESIEKISVQQKKNNLSALKNTPGILSAVELLKKSSSE